MGTKNNSKQETAATDRFRRLIRWLGNKLLALLLTLVAVILFVIINAPPNGHAY
jgi:hypothetical protein